jgi:DNA-binding winged helix-turn-helix (wHTH) protein
MNSGYAFGSFCAMPRRRLLLETHHPVQIGSRALDILLALLERPGELVTKGELMKRVWPTTIVGEDNLAVQVSMLRRVLREGGADGSIVNVPGRGYVFTMSVELIADYTHSPDVASVANTNLPAPRLQGTLHLAAAE